jgi:hypothetical protein
LRTYIKALFAAAALPFFMCFAGCRSHHVEITVENRTGAEIRLLEVDYPSASFGVNSVAAGQTVHSSIQVQGSGEVKVQYTAPDRHQAQITGPALAEKQEGTLAIALLPNDKADFRLR